MRLLGKKAIPIVFSLGLIILSLIVMSCSPKTEELSPPRITSPLYEGAEVVEAWGFTPEAEVRIYADGGDIGGGSCWFSKCTFNVKKISANQKITATQTVDGVTSDPTRDEHAVTVQKIPDQFLDPKYNKERLVAPLVDSPLVECQRIVPVKNLVEGVLVQVFSPPNINNPIGETRTPWNYARPGTTELKKDQKIVANQKLYFPNPSDLSSPEESVKAKPTKLEAPVIDEAYLVVGSHAVGVRNLWIGAEVDIYYEEPGKPRESIGGGLAPWSGTIFPVKPLKDAWVACPKCIKADQSLCDIKATSTGGTVKNSLDPLVIREPICAGSLEVTVCNIGPNPILNLFLKGNPDKQVAQQGSVGSCTAVTLGDKLYLKNLDEIYAIQKVGNLESRSDTVRVVDKSAPIFEIGNGNFCKPCSGQEYGPIFVRNTLTNKYGPVFKATMCGAEKAIVDIRGPNGTLIESINLEEIKGKKGYFEDSWDWNKIGWKTAKDIPSGKYKATFKIWPTGPGSEQDKYFYVTTQGCVEMEVLCAHNKYRAQVNTENPNIPPLDPLTWSDTLADHAQKWADSLAKTGQLEHDPNRGNEGENLYQGSSSYTDAVELWAQEKKCFKNEPFPNIYNGQCDTYTVNKCNEYKDWHCAGHYSQIVWRNTTQVGCGMANGIVDCRYSPPGNYAGQKTY